MTVTVLFCVILMIHWRKADYIKEWQPGLQGPQRKWTCTVVGFVVIASTLAINTAIKECVLKTIFYPGYTTTAWLNVTMDTFEQCD